MDRVQLHLQLRSGYICAREFSVLPEPLQGTRRLLSGEGLTDFMFYLHHSYYKRLGLPAL